MGYELLMLNVPSLAGLVEQYGPTKVWNAARDALGFPANLISTIAEAANVAEHLAQTEKGELQ